MDRIIIDVFEEDADADVVTTISPWELALTGDLTEQNDDDELGLRSLATPALGTGAARVSTESCAYAAASALYWHVLLGGSRLREVVFVLYDKHALEVFIEELAGVILGDGDLSTEDDDDVEQRNPGLDETIHLTEVTVGRTSA